MPGRIGIDDIGLPDTTQRKEKEDQRQSVGNPGAPSAISRRGGW